MNPTTLHRIEHAAIALIAVIVAMIASHFMRPPMTPAPIVHRYEKALVDKDSRACALADERYLSVPSISKDCVVTLDPDADATCGENPAGFVVKHRTDKEILVSDCQAAYLARQKGK